MNARKRPYHLLEAHHLSIGYSVVERDSLRVLPLANELFKDPRGWHKSGVMEWQPGVAAHQLLLRNARPARKWAALHERFATQVRTVDALLAKHNAMLLPTGASPFMHPAQETVLVTGDDGERNALNDRLFNCAQHGWSNNNGADLSLTFSGDGEFSKLHAAARLLLPIIPGLAASSPLLEGAFQGFHDARLEAGLHAREKHPELMGSLIPEPVYTQEDHDREILAPIAQLLGELGAIPGLDPEQANARGVVARFDRQLMEIQVTDTQECVAADLAVAELINAVLRALASGRWVSTYLQRAWSESDLLPIFLQTIKDAGNTLVTNRDYLLMFGLMKQEQLSVQKLWQHLFVDLYGEIGPEARQPIAHILEHGCLASRILRHTGRTPAPDKLRTVFRELAECNRTGRLFV